MFGKEIYDLIKSGSEKGSVELDALFLQSLKLQEAYNTILPKVTPKLIRDLFARLQENPHIKQPIYMIEIFTKKKERKEEGTITKEEQFREYLISISGGSIPAIYDHDSHYVINMRLTFDILKALNDIKFVLEICGDYTVGGSVTVYKNAGLVDSVEKSAGYTEDSVISPDGHFVFKLPSGVYRITVAYPDGKDQIIENYAVWPGSYTSLNLIR